MELSESERQACEWFLRATADYRDARRLAAAEAGCPNAVWLAQQAVEKAIKSILILHQIPFPRSHNLEQLRKLLPDNCALKTQPPDLDELTQISVQTRYPGEYDPADEDSVQRMLDLAGEVIWILTSEFDEGLLKRYLPRQSGSA